MYRLAVTLAVSLMFIVAVAPAYAGGDCYNPCGKEVCICHNIGGPRDLGANCDMTGNCSYVTDEGRTITLTGRQFLGIIIGFNQSNDKALRAHLNHGDGRILVTFDPPLHLASQIGPHRASNVECMGERAYRQPPEPGN